MESLDDDDFSYEEDRPRRERRPASEPRRRRGGGPPDRQLLLRRAIALGVGLLILILLALAVRGCLNAREERAMRDYVRDLASVVTETQQTGDAFFARMSAGAGGSVTEFVDEINADRSAMDAYLNRIEALDVPGDLQEGHDGVLDSYRMRAQAMTTIADQMRTALGDQGREEAVARISRQMSVLYAGDFVYALLGQAPLARALEERGMTEVDVPTSQLVPDGTTWLDEGRVSSALGVAGGPAPVGEAVRAPRRRCSRPTA